MAFPSPRRGPIFSTLSAMMKQLGADGFRPHEGDPSSLLTAEDKKLLNDWFPSPRRGPIFFTNILILLAQFKIVSVPTKGTHLLYTILICITPFARSFRPHEGDPSSLRITAPLYWWKELFPSPRRGPIFSTLIWKLSEDCRAVSVPTKGTHLLYGLVGLKNKKVYRFPSPRRGPIFSTLEDYRT